MAIMARVLGIPARVAVGFLAPDPGTGASTYVYTAHDLHAWPELYFDGAGWVRFEPTPAGRAGDVPVATPGSARAPRRTRPQSAEPSQGASSNLPDNRIPVEETDVTTGDFAGSGGGSGRWLLAGGAVLLGALLLVGALAPPRGPRPAARAPARQRRPRAGLGRAARHRGRPGHRLARRPVTARHSQPTGRPARHAGRPGDTRASGARRRDRAATPSSPCDRLVHELELQRYARPGSPADHATVRTDTESVLTALVGGAAGSARRRASWWPRSVLGRSAAGPGVPARRRSRRRTAGSWTTPAPVAVGVTGRRWPSLRPSAERQ